MKSQKSCFFFFRKRSLGNCFEKEEMDEKKKRYHGDHVFLGDDRLHFLHLKIRSLHLKIKQSSFFIRFYEVTKKVFFFFPSGISGIVLKKKKWMKKKRYHRAIFFYQSIREYVFPLIRLRVFYFLKQKNIKKNF